MIHTIQAGTTRTSQLRTWYLYAKPVGLAREIMNLTLSHLQIIINPKKFLFFTFFLKKKKLFIYSFKKKKKRSFLENFIGDR
jgi:hypothetical protein